MHFKRSLQVKYKINKISENLINLIDFEISQSNFYDEAEAESLIQKKF